MSKLSLIFQLWRHFGTRWLIYRSVYGLQKKTGYVQRKTPALAWDQAPLADFLFQHDLQDIQRYAEYRRTQAPAFFFQASHRSEYQKYFSPWDQEGRNPVTLSDNLNRGVFRYFHHRELQVGLPPDWHQNPLTGQRAPAQRHWSKIPDFDYGDIKLIWEPSRFSFVYDLVRAYWRTGDECYPSLFWQLVEDWRAHNPPNQGPNWKCGQETTFRVMAWVFGLYGFADASVTTPEPIAHLAQMIAISGERIAANLNYALSQRNNHGISEGVGLWTIGLLFPEFRQAGKWREKGRWVLEKLGRELIYDDGAFVQHSVNYHRLMLQDYLWALRLGQIHNQPFSQTLLDRIANAGEWLYQIQDETSGRVPYYGQNDGSLVLPLNNCDYLDFRPVVQAIRFLTHHQLPYNEGPWDEDLLWIFGPDALNASRKPMQRKPLQAKVGGYYTLTSEEGMLFVRCGTYHDRPGQADMLHTDIWWRGQNIALDPGTFSYNAAAPWDNALAHTQYHNTVTVDDKDQMDRVGKFLWLPWLHGVVRFQTRSPQGLIKYWEGEHDGYQRLPNPVSHRRAILQLPEDSWLIIDALKANNSQKYQLQWLLPDMPYTWLQEEGNLQLHTSSGEYQILIKASDPCKTVLNRASSGTPAGWYAHYYQSLTPALSLNATAHAKTIHFFTLFTPLPAHLHINQNQLNVNWKEKSLVTTLSATSNDPIVMIAKLTDSLTTETLSVL